MGGRAARATQRWATTLAAAVALLAASLPLAAEAASLPLAAEAASLSPPDDGVSRPQTDGRPAAGGASAKDSESQQGKKPGNGTKGKKKAKARTTLMRVATQPLVLDRHRVVRDRIRIRTGKGFERRRVVVERRALGKRKWGPSDRGYTNDKGWFRAELLTGGIGIWEFRATVPGTDTAKMGRASMAPIALPSPPRPGSGVMWISISAGGERTCALDRRGRPYCWGDGSSGALGHGGFGPALLPLPVTASGALSGHALGMIATGAAHTCALDIEGRAYCWGRGEEGQLGDGSARTFKVAVPVAMPADTRFATITVGDSHTCAVTDTQRLYCWGDNRVGQLGTAGPSGSPVPVAVNSVSAGAVVSVAAGARHTCAVTAEGTAICWGEGTQGQLGGAIVDQRGPTAVAADSRYVEIAAGADFTCATTTAARVECWGAGQRGQLGDGAAADRPEPAPISADAPLDLLTAGGSAACARTSPDGSVVCWGADESGQGGDGDHTDAVVPMPVPLPPGEVAALSTGGGHTCAVTADGLAHCWGAGDKGQLGIDLRWPSFRPVTVSEPIR